MSDWSDRSDRSDPADFHDFLEVFLAALKGEPMIPFSEAYRIVMGSARRLELETVELSEALGRVLAEDVYSDIDMPPFDKSAMDGYACRREDLGRELRVLETVQAGQLPSCAVGAGECSRIMTGAKVPEGADCVFMFEDSEETASGLVRFCGTRTQDNICAKAEDLRAGDCVLRQGTPIGPQHVAVLATVGHARVRVSCRPRVSVLATGDELVGAGERPGPVQIRNSNSPQLCAQIRAMGCLASDLGIVRDEPAVLDAAMGKALAESDAVLLSGGVSMGDYDFVPESMVRNGLEILFDSIAVKPGKPTTFGVSPRVCCFGLSGNPVSTFIQFEILVKAFLYAMMGHEYHGVRVRLPLAEAIRRKKTEREAWLPVIIGEDGLVRTAEFHGSAHINALSGAQGLISMPVGVAVLEKNEVLEVRLY